MIKKMLLSTRQRTLVGLLFLLIIGTVTVQNADASSAPSTSSSSSSSPEVRGGSTKPAIEKLSPSLAVKPPPTSTLNDKTPMITTTQEQQHATTTTAPPIIPPVVSSSTGNLPTGTTIDGTDDSLDKFANDVARVLKDLRQQPYDPTVNKMFHSSKRPTFAVTWTHQMWEQHTSRLRFLHQFIYWHKSALLQRVIPQLSALMAWTIIAILIIDTNISTPISNIHFPMTSLSLISGFVGSLLALRSNQGLSRLMEARTIFGKVVHYTRDLSSIISNFIMPTQPQVGLMMARHLALFSWLLKQFLRGTKINGTDEDLIRTMLPHPLDADYVLHHRKVPVAALNRIRQGLHYCSHHCHDQRGDHLLTSSEETSIDHPITSMDQGIMMAEKLIASPIPPLFTTHAGRLLVFYLFFLPLALHSSGSLNSIGTFLTVFAVGYAMLGLDEISHLMEQPFKYVPMWDLCKNSMADVADSFCFQPPSLFGHEEVKNHNGIETYNKIPKPYWPGDGTFPVKSLDKDQTTY